MPLYRATSTEFHPEFGYLVPTRKLRNTLRVALGAALFGLVTGAVGAMVLLPRLARDLRLEEAASGVPATTVGVAIAPTDATESDGNTGPLAVVTDGKSSMLQDGVAKVARPKGIAGNGIAGNGVAPNGVAPKGSGAARSADAAPASTPDADKPCKEETWPYFDSKCLWGGPAKDASASAQPTRTEPGVNPTEQHPAVAATTPPKRKAKAAPVRRRQEPDPRTARSYYGYGYAFGPFGRAYGNDSGRSGGYARRDWGYGW